MTRTSSLFLSLALLPCSLPAGDPPLGGSPSLQGFTGLLNIPDALIAPEGHVFASYNNQIDPRYLGKNGWWDNYFVNIGVLPGLEGGFRFIESRLGQGPRDLSVFGKYQIPGLPAWGPRLAIGSQDYPGAAPFFRTNYAVATQDLGPLRMTAGYGHGPQRMKGVFGGAELRVTDWMQLLAEHDTKDRSGGIRLGVPSGWLPDGVRLGGILKRTLGGQGARSDVAVYVRFPLGHEVARREARVTAPAALLPAGPVQTRDPEGRALPGGRADSAPGSGALVAALVSHGFEDVQVGHAGRTLVVRCENSRYNHSELDGLGVILGMATAHASEPASAIRVVLLNHRLPVLSVEAPLDSLRSFFLEGEEAARVVLPDLRTRLLVTGPGLGVEGERVAYEAKAVNTGALRPRLLIYPGLASTIGSEVGAIEHRLSILPDLFLPLWSGAGLNARWDFPVSWSENYRPGALFGTRGTYNRLDRLMLQQTLPVLPGLTTQVAVGQYQYGDRGWMNQTIWSPGEGRHQLQLTGGRLQDDGHRIKETLIGTYRLYLPSLDSHLLASYGTFLNGDTGYRIDLRRHFGDTVLALFYARTAHSMTGFTFSFPLTPRRDMKPGLVQVRGSEQWRWGLTTTLFTPNYNPLVPGLAETPSTPHGLREAIHDQDRLKGSYLRSHLARLREAYLLFGR